jgi:hypothetical protein
MRATNMILVLALVVSGCGASGGNGGTPGAGTGVAGSNGTGAGGSVAGSNGTGAGGSGAGGSGSGSGAGGSGSGAGSSGSGAGGSGSGAGGSGTGAGGSGTGAGGSGTGAGGSGTGAGGSGTGGMGGVAMGTGRYLPLKVNSTWMYKVTDPATLVVATKTHKVEALELVGGMKPTVMAFRVRESTVGAGSSLSWQEDRTTSIVRHREQTIDAAGVIKREEWYGPYRLRVDESAAHTVKGATWMETYNETQIPMGMPAVTTPRIDTWAVEATDEVVTVPAGTFRCLRVHRVGQMTATGIVDKTYWFARGVGKVKEIGGSGNEDLLSYVP